MSSKTGASKEEDYGSLLRIGSDEVHDQGLSGTCQSQALASAARQAIAWRNIYYERKEDSPEWPPLEIGIQHPTLVRYFFRNLFATPSSRGPIKNFCLASFYHPNIKLLNQLEITIDNITSYDELERILKNQSKTGAQVTMDFRWLDKKTGLNDTEKRDYNCPEERDTDANWTRFRKGRYVEDAYPRLERGTILRLPRGDYDDDSNFSLPIGRKYWLPSQNDREYYADRVLRQGRRCMKFANHRMVVSNFNFDKNPTRAYSPWIEVKNSWGEKSGDKGFYKFSVDFIRTFFNTEYYAYGSPHGYFKQEYPILRQLACIGKLCQGKSGRPGYRGTNYPVETGLGGGLAVSFLVIKPKLNNWKKKEGTYGRPRGLSEISLLSSSSDSTGRGKGGESKHSESTDLASAAPAPASATIRTPLLPTGAAKDSSGGGKTKRKRKRKRKKKTRRKKRCSKKRLKKKMICHKGTKRKLKKLRKLTKKLKVKLTKCSKKRLKKWKGGSRKKRGGNKIGDDCPICQEKMKESETNIDVHMGNRRRKTHYFHKECINKWCPKNEITGNFLHPWKDVPCPLCNQKMQYRKNEPVSEDCKETPVLEYRMAPRHSTRNTHPTGRRPSQALLDQHNNNRDWEYVERQSICRNCAIMGGKRKRKKKTRKKWNK